MKKIAFLLFTINFFGNSYSASQNKLINITNDYSQLVSISYTDSLNEIQSINVNPHETTTINGPISNVKTTHPLMKYSVIKRVVSSIYLGGVYTSNDESETGINFCFFK